MTSLTFTGIKTHRSGVFAGTRFSIENPSVVQSIKGSIQQVMVANGFTPLEVRFLKAHVGNSRRRLGDDLGAIQADILLSVRQADATRVRAFVNEDSFSRAVGGHLATSLRQSDRATGCCQATVINQAQASRCMSQQRDADAMRTDPIATEDLGCEVYQLATVAGVVAFLMLALYTSRLYLESVVDDKDESQVHTTDVEMAAIEPEGQPTPEPGVQETMTRKKAKDIAIPVEFICPITQEIMTEPMMAEDGHTYERSAISRWLKKHKTSPKAGSEMGKQLFVNYTVKQLISGWLEEHPEHRTDPFTTLQNVLEQLSDAIRERNRQQVIFRAQRLIQLIQDEFKASLAIPKTSKSAKRSRMSAPTTHASSEPTSRKTMSIEPMEPTPPSQKPKKQIPSFDDVKYVDDSDSESESEEPDWFAAPKKKKKPEQKDDGRAFRPVKSKPSRANKGMKQIMVLPRADSTIDPTSEKSQSKKTASFDQEYEEDSGASDTTGTDGHAV